MADPPYTPVRPTKPGFYRNMTKREQERTGYPSAMGDYWDKIWQNVQPRPGTLPPYIPMGTGLPGGGMGGGIGTSFPPGSPMNMLQLLADANQQRQYVTDPANALDIWRASHGQGLPPATGLVPSVPSPGTVKNTVAGNLIDTYKNAAIGIGDQFVAGAAMSPTMQQINYEAAIRSGHLPPQQPAPSPSPGPMMSPPGMVNPYLPLGPTNVSPGAPGTQFPPPGSGMTYPPQYVPEQTYGQQF